MTELQFGFIHWFSLTQQPFPRHKRSNTSQTFVPEMKYLQLQQLLKRMKLELCLLPIELRHDTCELQLWRCQATTMKNKGRKNKKIKKNKR